MKLTNRKMRVMKDGISDGGALCLEPELDDIIKNNEHLLRVGHVTKNEVADAIVKQWNVQVDDQTIEDAVVGEPRRSQNVDKHKGP